MARLESKDLVLRLVLTLVVVLCPSIAQAQDYSFRIRNLPTDQAYRGLLYANMFNLGGAGFGATITPEEKAFRVLFASPTAIAQFQQLLNEGNPEGQLYALYGLYLNDAQLFKNAAARLKYDDGPPARWEGFIFLEKGKIRFVDGCVWYHADRHVIIERMANGDFDQAFKAPSPTLKYPPLKY